MRGCRQSGKPRRRFTALHIAAVVPPQTASAWHRARVQNVAKQNKPKKLGRPKLPRSEVKGKIVPVRFEPDDLKLVTAAAKVANKTVSEWIRETLRTAAEVYMFDSTLHEAIRTVLSQRKNFTATTSEISEEIEKRGLYARKDAGVAKASQINARVRKHPELFKFVEPGIVRLVSNREI
jgi:hypothetical protein